MSQTGETTGGVRDRYTGKRADNHSVSYENLPSTSDESRSVTFIGSADADRTRKPATTALGTVARCPVFVFRPGQAVRAQCPGYHAKLTPHLGQRSAPPMQVIHSVVFPTLLGK